MNRRKKAMLTACSCILAAGLFTGCGSSGDKTPTPTPTPTPSPAAEAEWLIVNYMAADNNLVSMELEDFSSMEKVGSTDAVQVVNFIDVGDIQKNTNATVAWKNGIKWNGGRLFHVEKNSVANTISSPVVKDYGATVDSGSANTLKDVVTTAMAAYPAKHVCVILNDHGGSYNGACQDTAAGSIMDMVSMKNALVSVTNASGQKLDVLGFDACLMGNLETANEVSGVADYMVMSSETEWGSWDYDGIFSKNVATPQNNAFAQAIKAMQTRADAIRLGKLSGSMSAEDLCKIIMKANKDEAATMTNGGIVTCAYYDTSKIPALVTAVENLRQGLAAADDAEKTKFVDAIIAASTCYQGAVPASVTGMKNEKWIAGEFFGAGATSWDAGTKELQLLPEDYYIYDLGYLLDTYALTASTTQKTLVTAVKTALDAVVKDCYGTGGLEVADTEKDLYYVEGRHTNYQGMSIAVPSKQYDADTNWVSTNYEKLSFYTNCKWADTIEALPKK